MTIAMSNLIAWYGMRSDTRGVGFWIFIACLAIIPFTINFVLRFVVAPLLVWRSQAMAASPVFVETASDELTPEMKSRLGRVIGEFTAQGFEVITNVKLAGAVVKVTAFS